LSEETKRGSEKKKKERKKERKKKGAVLNSGAAAQPRRLAGHRAGNGYPAGEEGSGGCRILERRQSLSLEMREERERKEKMRKKKPEIPLYRQS